MARSAKSMGSMFTGRNTSSAVNFSRSLSGQANLGPASPSVSTFTLNKSVARAALPATTGTHDLTGWTIETTGKHAAVVFANNAITDATLATGSIGSVSLIGSTGLVTYGHVIREGGPATTASGTLVGHRETANRCPGFLVPTTSSPNVWGADYDFVQWNATGPRFSNAAASTGGNRLLHAAVLSGDAVVETNLQHKTVTKTAGGSVDISLSFPPTFMICINHTDQVDDGAGHRGLGLLGMAFVSRTTGKTASSFLCTRGKDHQCYGWVSSTKFVTYDASRIALGDPTYEFSFSFPDDQTIRITTDVVGSDAAPEMTVLSVQLPEEWKAQTGIVTLPTSTGSKTFGNADFSNNINFTPELMFFLPSQMVTLDAAVDNSANAAVFGLAVASADAQMCAVTGKHATTDPISSFSISDDQLFNIPDHAKAESIKATFTRFVFGGFIANFTAVESTARKFPFLAIGR